MKSRFATAATLLALVAGGGGAIAVGAGSTSSSNGGSANGQYNGNGKKCGISPNPACPPNSNGNKPKNTSHTNSAATNSDDLNQNVGFDRADNAALNAHSSWAELSAVLTNVQQDLASAIALNHAGHLNPAVVLSLKALFLDVLNKATTINQTGLQTLLTNQDKAAAHVLLAQINTTWSQLLNNSQFVSAGFVGLQGQTVEIISDGHNLASDGFTSHLTQLRFLRLVLKQAIAEAEAKAHPGDVAEASFELRVINTVLLTNTKAHRKAIQKLANIVAAKMAAAQDTSTTAYAKLALESKLLGYKLKTL